MASSGSTCSPFQQALSLIDAAHSLDPNVHTLPDGSTVPYELHYARRSTHYLSLRSPDASEALQLAVRSQHFRRWEVPRSDYPMTKAGYYAWRTGLGKRMAEMAKQVCLEAGLQESLAERVAQIVRKEGVKKSDNSEEEEAAALEDVACLVFLEDRFEEFITEHDEAKVISVVQKTWGKMSKRGRDLALGVEMSDRCKEVVVAAISTL